MKNLNITTPSAGVAHAPLTRTKSIRLVSAVAVIGFALAACGGSDEPASGDPLPDDVATTSSTSTTVLSVVAEESAPPSTAAPDAEPAPEPESAPPTSLAPAPTGSDGACLVGDWKITDAELNSYNDVLSAQAAAGADLSIDTTGEVLLSFTETDYRYVGNFELELRVGGQSGTGDATGSVDGTWAAADGIITAELGTSDLNIVVTVSGVTVDGSDMGNGILQANPINNAPFSCDGPTLMFQAGADDAVRHPVLLTPA